VEIKFRATAGTENIFKLNGLTRELGHETMTVVGQSRRFRTAPRSPVLPR
jgi:hypothetical protein